MISGSAFILTYWKHLPLDRSVHLNSFEFFPTSSCLLLLLPHKMPRNTLIIHCYVYVRINIKSVNFLKYVKDPIMYVVLSRLRGFLFWFFPINRFPRLCNCGFHLFIRMYGRWLNNELFNSSLMCHTFTVYHISTNMNLFNK